MIWLGERAATSCFREFSVDGIATHSQQRSVAAVADAHQLEVVRMFLFRLVVGVSNKDTTAWLN